MPPDENAGLLAAVESGIAEASAPLAPSPTPEPAGGVTDAQPATPDGTATPVDGTDGGGGAPAAISGGEGTDDGAPTGEDADAEGAAGEGDGEGAAPGTGDGTDKPVDGAGEPTATGKEADPLNDPLPNALKRETKERIKTLIGMVQDKDEKLKTVEGNYSFIMQEIKQTQATPEQYAQALDYLRLVNSDAREDKEQLLEFLQRETIAIAKMIGKPVPGVNMLEGHDDLVQKVGAGRLSIEDAQEIAASREARTFQQRRTQMTAEQQRVTAETQREVATARAGLTALEQQLMRDPAYPTKKAILVKTLKPVFAKIPPSEWVATFKRAYNELAVPAAPSVPTPTPAPRAQATSGGGGNNTPLRAQQPSGGAQPEPRNVLDAINAGIAAARR